MIRDEELNRLVRYAQGMGVSVRFKPYVNGSKVGGGWTTDGSEIVIYVSPGDSKISKILTLIHELGHHRGFIENNRKIDPKALEALEDEEEKKKSRKIIYLDEASDTQYWEQIYKDTDCKFDMAKLYAARDFDIWCYEVFYETGRFPTLKNKIKKSKELRFRYKNNRS